MSELERETVRTVDEISRLHQEALAAEEAARAAMAKAGVLLIGMKRSLRHGNWLPWLEKDFPFSFRTAQRYMRAAKRRGG